MNLASLRTIVLMLIISIPIHSQEKRITLSGAFPDLNSEKLGNYLAHPYDLDFYNDQYFLTDTRENCIKVFSTDGNLIKTIGRKGTGPGELSQPYALTIDKRDAVIYCQEGNRRISCFSTEGEFVKIIKSTPPIWDMVAFDGILYASAYNEANDSIFVMYNEAGEIIKFFGDYFDPKINTLPPKYRQILYGNATLKFNGHSLYVFYERLPFIQIYNKSGTLQHTISINIKEIQRLYKNNQSPKPKGGRMGIKSWLAGASIVGDRIYCYSPYELRSLLVLNHQGDLTDIITLNKLSKDQLIMNKFMEKSEDTYIFIDFEDSQVKFYR